MTLEQIVAALEGQSVIVWNLGRGTQSPAWHCRLLDVRGHARHIGQRGLVGYDLPSWFTGHGPTMLTALSAAAQQAEAALGITIFAKGRMHEEIDLAKLLG